MIDESPVSKRILSAVANLDLLDLARELRQYSAEPLLLQTPKPFSISPSPAAFATPC